MARTCGQSRAAMARATATMGAGAQATPPDQQARAASLQIVMIGLALCAILLWRPRGLLGETRILSRHVQQPGTAATAAATTNEP